MPFQKDRQQVIRDEELLQKQAKDFTSGPCEYGDVTAGPVPHDIPSLHPFLNTPAWDKCRKIRALAGSVLSI